MLRCASKHARLKRIRLKSMSSGRTIAIAASLIGEPARAQMLAALMSGKALTASELAQAAGITPQTASSHLRQLERGNLVTMRAQGRHRYFCLRDGRVASLLENLLSLEPQMEPRTGPKDMALREARICYDHLAGERGVMLHDTLRRKKYLQEQDNVLFLSRSGEIFCTKFGLDLQGLRAGRRPLCRACLDWSARRSHLGGALGAAFFSRMESLRWLRRATGSRAVTFSPMGARKFLDLFGPDS